MDIDVYLHDDGKYTSLYYSKKKLSYWKLAGNLYFERLTIWNGKMSNWGIWCGKLSVHQTYSNQGSSSKTYQNFLAPIKGHCMYQNSLHAQGNSIPSIAYSLSPRQPLRYFIPFRSALLKKTSKSVDPL